MAEQEQDRSEEATPFKRSEARRRGSVAKSLELSSLFALLTLVVVLLVQGRPMIERQLRMNALLLDASGRQTLEPARVAHWFTWLAEQTLGMLMPLLLGIVAVAVLGGLLQSGPVFSLHALKPDIDRINPVAGFKRLFTIRLLYEAVKNIVKLVLFTAVLWLLFRSLVMELMALMSAAPVQMLDATFHQAVGIVFKLTLIVAAVAAVDVVFSRWQWLDRLKMSRREVREELKQREGDPRIRSRLRELRKEMLARARSMRRLPEADVLITNPTHLAVALLYRRESMAAPQVIAKGSGEAAAHMRVVARRHGVPIVQNPTLARALFGGQLDSAVPERLYPTVARVLAWCYALREARR
jgi:flagellar biosynthetic protein FlhB